MATAAQLSQAETDYYDNAGYAENLSVSQCRAFITAARRLIMLLPSSQTKGANSLSLSPALIAKEREEAQAWLEKHSPDDIPGPLVTKTDFSGMRRG